MSTFTPALLALGPPGPHANYHPEEVDAILVLVTDQAIADAWLDHRAEAARDIAAMDAKGIAVRSGLWDDVR